MASKGEAQLLSRKIYLLMSNKLLNYHVNPSISFSVLASLKKFEVKKSLYTNSSNRHISNLKYGQKVNLSQNITFLDSYNPNKFFFRCYPRGVRGSREVRNSSEPIISFENIGESLRSLELADSTQNELELARIQKYKALPEKTSKSTNEYEAFIRDKDEKELSMSLSPEVTVNHDHIYSRNHVQPELNLQQLPQIQSSKDIDNLSLPELSRVAGNIVPFVNRFPTLQKLVHLGVDLSIIQRYAGIGAHLLRCSDFDKEVAPLVRFLADICVPLDRVGEVLTSNPYLFTEDPRELEKRVGYLIHMKFTLPQVGSMVTDCPMLLLMTPQRLDKKLGTLQQSFSLTGEEVRLVAVKHPRILPFKRRLIAITKFVTKEMVGFVEKEMKTIILKCPEVFTTPRDHIVKNMDYLHNAMLIPHGHVLIWPAALIGDTQQLKHRHQFLVSRGRAQYDPCEPRYVSLKALIDSDDTIFCHVTAKCQVTDFYEFLKTV